jgi:DNA-binding MarR family transcriptional regulator
MLTKRFQFIEPARPYRELQILSEIARNPRTSQRELAERAMIGPTMVNRYVAEMQRDGLVEVEGETNRTFRYRLTEAGRYRRDELFFQVSKEVVQFYGQAKQDFRRRLREHARRGVRRVVLFGAAETAELVYAAAEGTGLEIVGIVDNDPAKHGRRIGTVRVGAPDTVLEMNPDAVLISSFGHADEIHDQIRPLEGRGIRVDLV